VKTLESILIEFIQEELDFFNVDIDDNYLYLFNSASEQQKRLVLDSLATIKESITTLQKIQDEIYYS